MKRAIILRYAIFAVACSLAGAGIYFQIRHPEAVAPVITAIPGAEGCVDFDDLQCDCTSGDCKDLKHHRSPVEAVKPSPTPTPTDATPEPEYAWAPQREEFVLSPGQQIARGPVGGSYAGSPDHPHFMMWEIKSSLPIDAGAIDANLVAVDSGGPGQIGQIGDINLLGSAVDLCYTAKTLQSRHSCRLPGRSTRGYILLRDTRPASPLLALVGRAAGIKAPLERQAAENRVSLTIWTWQCQAWCKAAE